MRTLLPALAVVLLLAAPARAEIAGLYDVKLEEVATNCNSPLRYPETKLTIKARGTSLTLMIDGTPVMVGAATKSGKISAKSKLGPTMIEGMAGVFSVAGSVSSAGKVQLMLVGEYSVNGKPLCTQSWNVTGARSAVKPK